MATSKYDRNWNIIGHVSDDGKTLYDKDHNVIGHVSDDGKTFYDKNWNVSGHLSNDGKTLSDKDWNPIGHVSDDGKTIYDKDWDVAERSETPSRVAYTRPRPSSYSSSSGETNWVLWLIGALIVLAILYFIFVVVVPFAILDISILALIGSLITTRRKKLLQWISLAGLLYLIVDIQAGWLSHHLVRSIEVSRKVIDYVFYANTGGGLAAAFFLIRDMLKVHSSLPEVENTKLANSQEKTTINRLVFVGASLVVIGGLMIYGYHRLYSGEVLSLSSPAINPDSFHASNNMPPDFTNVLAQGKALLRQQMSLKNSERHLSSAINYLEKAVSLNQSSQEAYYFLGSAYDYLNRLDDEPLLTIPNIDATIKASACFQKVISIAPKYEGDMLILNPYSKLSSVWGELGTAYAFQEKVDSAKWAFLQGIQVGGFPPAVLEYGRNLLRSVQDNAILFTNGDDDTFPLFFLQLVEGIRRDVIVVNLGLLNAPWYIKRLKTSYPFAKEPLKILFTESQISDLAPIKYTKENRYLPVPPEILSRYKKVDPKVPSRREVVWTIPAQTSRYLRVQDIMVYNILQSNEWRRPIYFSITCPADGRIGLDDYLWYEGLVHQLYPTKVGLSQDSISEILETHLLVNPDLPKEGVNANYEFSEMSSVSSLADPRLANAALNYRSAFIRLALYFANVANNKQKSLAALERMEESIPRAKFSPGWELASDIAAFYHRLGRDDKYDEMVSEIEPVLHDLINKGHVNMNTYYNPYRVLLDIYEAKSDFERMLGVLRSLEKLYPNDPGIQQRIRVAEAELSKKSSGK